MTGEQPDRHTLSSVLSACAGLALYRLGIQMHQLVKGSYRTLPLVMPSSRCMLGVGL